jgi:hypothetical protein
MSSSKLLSRQKLVLISILTLLTGCGSFAPTSFVSSDGIYSAVKATAETKSTLYYKNYFKEKEIEFENKYYNDTIVTNNDFVNSTQITYTKSNAAWGDIPDDVTITFDMFDNLYHKRYFGFGYYNPYYGYYPYGSYYPYYDPFYGYGYGYGFGYGYWDPFYRYGYWDPFWGPYSWGSNRFYGYPYNYNMLGYNRYNRPFYQDDYSYRKSNNVSYNNGRRGSANNVVVYSDGKSLRSNNDENKSLKNANNIRSSINPSIQQYNGRNLKDFDMIVERAGGNSEKVRNYATKPEIGAIKDSRIKESPRIYINKGSSNNNSSSIDNYNSSRGSSSQKRYYTNPQYNNNSSWRISGRNYADPSSRADGSRRNSNSSVRSYANPSSSSSYSSPANNSSSNISRSSYNSISSPSRGSVSGGASISRGSSSSGSARGVR